MSRRRERVVDLIGEHRYDNITDDSLADRILAAVANHPEKAEGEERPETLFASVELRIRNKCHTTATARAHARIDALIEEIEERLAEMRGGR